MKSSLTTRTETKKWGSPTDPALARVYLGLRLEVPGAALREWLTACEVSWIEDPTNTDVRFTRNRIRRELMPALEACFPTIRHTLTMLIDWIEAEAASRAVA